MTTDGAAPDRRDGTGEIVVLPLGDTRASVFRLGTDRAWDYFSEIVNLGCDGVRDALVAGKFSIVASASKELEVAGRMNWPPDCNAGRLTAQPR
jgi:hypothetical protein